MESTLCLKILCLAFHQGSCIYVDQFVLVHFDLVTRTYTGEVAVLDVGLSLLL